MGAIAPALATPALAASMAPAALSVSRGGSQPAASLAGMAVECENCESAAAVVVCQQCQCSFCSACSDQIHRSKAMKKHSLTRTELRIDQVFAVLLRVALALSRSVAVTLPLSLWLCIYRPDSPCLSLAIADCLCVMRRL